MLKYYFLKSLYLKTTKNQKTNIFGLFETMSVMLSLKKIRLLR
jgi:hypothetical protein